MKRPRGPARVQQLKALRAVVPLVRHAWELGRRRRRVEADLRVILAGAVHTWIVPIRAGDPRVARLQLDRQLQVRLRELGLSDEHGLVFGGETRVAHRPFTTTTLGAIRTASHGLERAFLVAAFASPLERSAFQLAPKDAREDEGASTEEQWHRAWLDITCGRYPKTIALQAIGLSEKAYNARRGRRRVRAGGLSIREQEILDGLHEQIASEDESLENQRQYRDYAARIAQERRLRLPKSLRIPRYARAMVRKLPADCRFLAKDRSAWLACLSRQPTRTRETWRILIEKREQRIAGVLATLAIDQWLQQHTKMPSKQKAS